MKYYTDTVPEGVITTMKRIGYDGDNIISYAEAIDWFLNKGVAIEISPYFTFALQNRMGFDYTISVLNEEECRIKKEKWEEFASFPLCMDCALEKAAELLFLRDENIQVK